jgi:hypothetical protein
MANYYYKTRTLPAQTRKSRLAGLRDNTTSTGTVGIPAGSNGDTTPTNPTSPQITLQEGESIRVERSSSGTTFRISHGEPGEPVTPGTAPDNHLTVVKNLLFDSFGHTLSKENIDLDGVFDHRYLRKDQPDKTEYPITFMAGAIFNDIIRSLNFTAGAIGDGWAIWTDQNGQTNLNIDNITVRQSLRTIELIIEKIKSVGGQIVVSAANGIIKTAQIEGNHYRITFEDDNPFQPGDLIRCAKLTGPELKSWWVEILTADNDAITIEKSEFDYWWSYPAPGDEVVLFGNTHNTSRQNLIAISATDDGQPRIDVFNGVNSKSFEGCLRARLGNLDGIFSDNFPDDAQPHGDGLYADNVFLKGKFLLQNGDDVSQRFEILDGRLNSLISAEVDNILRNAVFNKNLNHWTANNLVNFIQSSNFIYIINAFYTEKTNIADIVTDNFRNVLRLKNTILTQLNDDFMISPAHGVHTIELYYKPQSEGTLNIGFPNTDFSREITMNPNQTDYQYMRFTAEWNGSGNFVLSCTGQVLIYDLKLLNDQLQNNIINLQTQITQTQEAITLLASKDYVNAQTGEIREHYDSVIQQTADQITIQCNAYTNSAISSAGFITSTEAATIYATREEYNDLNQTIYLHSAWIETNAESIELAVQEINSLNGTEIVSRINMTPSTVSISAEHINLTGDITANGNVHINQDGTLIAKGGIFNGFLQMPFKKISLSDATYTGYEYNTHYYVLGDYANVITGDDAPSNRDYVYLPKNTGWNGRIISIINQNPPSQNVSGMFYATTISIQGGDAFMENIASVPDNYTAPTNVTLRAGMIQFCCIVINNNARWMILTAQKQII